MFYIIYVSSATKLMGEGELLSLLQSAREKNDGLKISGMLLYKGGNFMQFMEGDKESVLSLYNSIKLDRRHKDVNKIVTGESKQRAFESWSMGFSNMDKIEDLQKYNKYIEESLVLRSFPDDVEDAYKFMMLFNESVR